VKKDRAEGAKNITLDISSVDIKLIKRHLERRGNLEGLFADRIVLIEGNHDEDFYNRLINIFKIPLPQNKFTLFIKTDGKKQLRLARQFYQQMCFDDIAAICDLDYIFSGDVKYLLKELGLDEDYPKRLCEYIEWTADGDPKLDYILEKLKEKSLPKEMERIIGDLCQKRIFILQHGTPEMYYKNNLGEKGGWVNLQSESDLLEVAYLKELMESVLK
jgi:hypothetical protein